VISEALYSSTPFCAFFRILSKKQAATHS